MVSAVLIASHKQNLRSCSALTSSSENAYLFYNLYIINSVKLKICRFYICVVLLIRDSKIKRTK